MTLFPKLCFVGLKAKTMEYPTTSASRMIASVSLETKILFKESFLRRKKRTNC